MVTMKSRSPLALALIALSLGSASLVAVTPAHSAPWLKSGELAGPAMVEQVSWRARRNTAIVAGVVGLGVLGIAAAAANQHRYQDQGQYYGGYPPAYGNGYRPLYGEDQYYAPRQPVYGYGQGYHQGYGYEEGFVRQAPVYRPRNGAAYYNPSARGSVQLDGLGRPIRSRGAGNN